jgi:hypothetical protein
MKTVLPFVVAPAALAGLALAQKFLPKEYHP